MNAPRLEARRWFQEAQADLAVVRTLRDAGHHAAACFHSQQAAEKALKALLYAYGVRLLPDFRQMRHDVCQTRRSRVVLTAP